VSYTDIPLTKQTWEELDDYFEKCAMLLKNLTVGGNNYYDVTKCDIVWYHRDIIERKNEITLRLNATIPYLQLTWIRLILNHGNIHIISEKATVFDWKNKSILTLRHCAGYEKIIQIKTTDNDLSESKIKRINKIIDLITNKIYNCYILMITIISKLFFILYISFVFL